MKSILMSIRPEWARKIFNGEKTIEVRKTAPKLETPFTVYVYQTKLKVNKGDSFMVVDALNENLGCGKVIGSFVCDGYDEFEKSEHGVRIKRFSALRETLLSVNEMREYIGDRKKVYGWHITEPKLFDKPRDVAEFMLGGGWNAGRFPLTRPPQSWCYVEEQE